MQGNAKRFFFDNSLETTLREWSEKHSKSLLPFPFEKQMSLSRCTERIASREDMIWNDSGPTGPGCTHIA